MNSREYNSLSQNHRRVLSELSKGSSAKKISEKLKISQKFTYDIIRDLEPYIKREVFIDNQKLGINFFYARGVAKWRDIPGITLMKRELINELNNICNGELVHADDGSICLMLKFYNQEERKDFFQNNKLNEFIDFSELKHYSDSNIVKNNNSCNSFWSRTLNGEFKKGRNKKADLYD